MHGKETNSSIDSRMFNKSKQQCEKEINSSIDSRRFNKSIYKENKKFN